MRHVCLFRVDRPTCLECSLSDPLMVLIRVLLTASGGLGQKRFCLRLGRGAQTQSTEINAAITYSSV